MRERTDRMIHRGLDAESRRKARLFALCLEDRLGAKNEHCGHQGSVSGHQKDTSEEQVVLARRLLTGTRQQ